MNIDGQVTSAKQDNNQIVTEILKQNIDLITLLSNKSICLVGGVDPSIELLVVRFSPWLAELTSHADYVTQQSWLEDKLVATTQFDRVLSRLDNSMDYDFQFSSEDFLHLIYARFIEEIPQPFSLSVNENDVIEFKEKWLSDIPSPYIGISWAERKEPQVGIDQIGVDLVDLIDQVKSMSGTLVIVQSYPSPQELEYIASQISTQVFDCSDLNDKPDELLVVCHLLDELIGVPDLSQHLRASLKKSTRILWPRQDSHISVQMNINQFSPWFPDATIYQESLHYGWKSAIQNLHGDLQFLWKTKTNIADNVIKLTDPSSAKPQETQFQSQEPQPQVQSLDMQQLIEYCSTKVAEELDSTSHQRVMQMVNTFNAAKIDELASVNIFVFHTEMGESAQLNYRDVKLNLNAYDYHKLLTEFVETAHHYHPDANIYLVTNAESSLFQLGGGKVRVVGMDIAVDQPMYQRVNAMYAYVMSDAFNADTLLLDSDAFLNNDFNTVLDADFDVAITTRNQNGLMPVNEGVILARNERKQNVAHFFRRYLATYESLIQDDLVQQYYGDIRKWRGGQLSLNAICHEAGPFSPFRQLEYYGSRLRVLPSDPYNYSWEYGQQIGIQDLTDKVVVHIKGARKVDTDKIVSMLRQLRPNESQQPQDAVSQATNGFVQPHFALFNKMFNEPPFGSKETVSDFANHVLSSAKTVCANQPQAGAFIADDMFVWFRNLGFLEEAEFIQAMLPYAEDQLLRARIWRVYMLCWAAKSCLSVDGDFVDLGCYDGRTVHVMARYSDFNNSNKQYYLYDLFDNPTDESRKAKHGPNLYDEVKQIFSDYPRVSVIKGPVPQSFAYGLPEKIAFAQIDLNEAEPEMAALDAIYDRITPGGMIIFDDFGFKRYKESHNREKAYLQSKGDIVFESPTGQGLLIKRG